MSGPYQKKWRDRCVVFLDDCFDRETASERLLAAGFHRVEAFLNHFPRTPGDEVREQGVKDPRIIRLCNQNGWLLVTTDSDIRHTHIEEIKKARRLAILATAHNGSADPDIWIEALILAKVDVERQFKKRTRPWYAQFNRDGKITTIFTVTEDLKTRRNRPGETDGA